MTAPNISDIIPSKAKTWVGLVSSLLTLGVPYVLSVSEALSPPWPVIIGLVIAVLGALGVYKAPYQPEGTTLAVDPTAPTVAPSVPSNAPVAAAPTAVPPPTGGYPNPWKR